MEEVVIEGLNEKLITLSVARDRLKGAKDDLANAESLYRYAIGVLETAMNSDPAIIEIREKLNTIRQVEEDATTCVSKAAMSAWRKGLTDGKKEWKHGDWEIRLRTIFTPVVTHVEDLITHLAGLKATGIIKRVTLNRKGTTDLNAKIRLNGLEIEEKTTCSVKCVSK